VLRCERSAEDHRSRRPQDAPSFAYEQPETDHAAKNLDHHDDVEGGVAKRQVPTVGPH
jgi:hypothetical protein